MGCSLREEMKSWHMHGKVDVNVLPILARNL